MGRLQSVFANLEEAERHLRIAMSLKPENEDARAYLGIILNFQGKADEAAECKMKFVTASKRTDVKIDRSCYCRLEETEE